MKDKVAIYTGELSYCTAKGILSLVESIDNLDIVVFLNHRQIPFQKKLILQWQNFKKNGIYRIVEVSNIVGRTLWNKCVARKYQQWGREQIPDYIEQLKDHKSIKICDVYDINSEASVNLIKDFSPKVGVSLAAPILKKSVIDIAELGNLNLHKGKLPEYRGMPPAFWEISNNEDSVGCSIHMINEQLDEGDLLLEEEVSIEQWSTPKGVQIQLDELGVKLMTKALSLYLSGDYTLCRQQGEGKTYSKPTLKQSADLIKRVSCYRGN